MKAFIKAFPKSVFALITLLAMAVCIPSGMAATVTWIGQGDTDNWSDVGNWQSGIAPQDGDTIKFPVANAVSNNDIFGLQVQSISTDVNFYANVTINGEAFELLGGITVARSNSSSRYFTINNSIVLAAGNLILFFMTATQEAFVTTILMES